MNTTHKYETREEWLHAAREMLLPLFESTPATVKDIRVSVGFPAGSRGSKNFHAIGECHYSADDSVPQIFIHPELTDPVRILGVLAHELTHAFLPIGTGHKGAFVTTAKGIGLTGKMTATTESEDFTADAQEIADTLGEYPHSRLTYANAKGRKQTTRQKKAECPEPDCGFVFRTTRKWIEAVPELCCPDPQCDGVMVIEE